MREKPEKAARLCRVPRRRRGEQGDAGTGENRGREGAAQPGWRARTCEGDTAKISGKRQVPPLDKRQNSSKICSCPNNLFFREKGGSEVDKDCGAWINLLSHRLKARLDASFQDLGITGVQSRVIFYILAHCGEGPVFQRDIENVFALSRSTATGILQVLEKNGMIRRERVAADARLKSLVPTQRAAELNAQVRDCLREADRMLTRGISEGQLQLFRETAALMLRNLNEWDECRCAEAAAAEPEQEGEESSRQNKPRTPCRAVSRTVSGNNQEQKGETIRC